MRYSRVIEPIQEEGAHNVQRQRRRLEPTDPRLAGGDSSTPPRKSSGKYKNGRMSSIRLDSVGARQARDLDLSPVIFIIRETLCMSP